MNEDFSKLLDLLVSISVDLSPRTVEELADRIGRLSDSKDSRQLLSWATTSKAKGFVEELRRLWGKVPEVSPTSLKLALFASSRTNKTISGRQSIELIWTGPKTEGVALRQTDQALLEVISSASKELLVVSFVAYNVDTITKAITKTIRNGIDVKMILEPENLQGGKVTFDSISRVKEMIPGIPVYRWPLEKRERNQQGRYGTLHAKCAVADDHVAYISSANLTGFAMELNMELGVLIKGGDIPRRIKDHFDELIVRGLLVKS